MRAESVIYSLLTASTAVTALVSARIFPGRLPQNTVMPAISYELVSSSEVLPINAQAGGVLMRSRVSVAVLARTYSEVKAIHEAVRKAVLFQRGAFGTVWVVSITRDLIGPDTRDDSVGLYMQGVDYMLTHNET